MFPRVTQRPTQDLGNCSDKGDDAGQNRQEAHEESIRIKGTEQPSGCQTDHHHDGGHAEPERDTLEP